MWPATNTQHAVFCQISVSNLLWSAFAQSTQGCRFPYEIIITNLVHSHDWVHGIFLCLNGVWSLSGLQWYSVETELLFYGQQKGNIHLGHDELKSNSQNSSKRGLQKAVWDLYTKTRLLKWLSVKYASTAFLWNYILAYHHSESVSLVFQNKTEAHLQTILHTTCSSDFIHMYKFCYVASLSGWCTCVLRYDAQCTSLYMLLRNENGGLNMPAKCLPDTVTLHYDPSHISSINGVLF